MEAKKNPTILFAGHLEEFDDLKKWGRNAPIADNEENHRKLSIISEAVIAKLNNSGRNTVMFLTSPKLAAKQTASLLGSKIKEKIGNKTKIRFVSIESMKSTYEGTFILPNDYTPGSFFEGLKLSYEIFSKESLEPSARNFHYRYGDPVLLHGRYKYPELVNLFSSYGETYSESLTRIFNAVIQMSNKAYKLDLNVELVIVAHSFNYFIFKGLELLGKKIIEEKFKIYPGDIVDNIWNSYKSRRGELKRTFYDYVDYSNLSNSYLIDLLKQEIEFIK